MTDSEFKYPIIKNRSDEKVLSYPNSDFCTHNNDSNYPPVLLSSIGSNGNTNSDSRSRDSDFYDDVSYDYGIAFFIKERKKHYYNLNKYVFKPLYILTEDSSLGGSEHHFFHNLTYRIKPQLDSILYSIYYDKSVKHMRHDKYELITKIECLNKKLKKHNDDVDSLKQVIIPNIIKSELKQASAIQTINYNYNYNEAHKLVIFILNEIWKSDDLESAFMNFDINKIEYEIKGNRLFLKGYDIADIKKEADKSLITSKIDRIIKNKEISNVLKCLLTNRPQLDLLTNDINKMALPISKMIENEDYDTKVGCCPTLWNLIEKYIF